MNDWRNRLFHDTLSSLVGEIMEEFIAFTKDLKKTYSRTYFTNIQKAESLIEKIMTILLLLKKKVIRFSIK